MITTDTNILIIGLGLIGGSYARGLSKKGYQVSAIDIDPDSIGYALEQGLIRAGSTEPDPALCEAADLIVFALYPTAMIDWVKEHQHLFRPGALLTDVAGVKCGVLDVIQGMLREDLEFIGSHPMAATAMRTSSKLQTLSSHRPKRIPHRRLPLPGSWDSCWIFILLLSWTRQPMTR